MRLEKELISEQVFTLAPKDSFQAQMVLINNIPRTIIHKINGEKSTLETELMEQN
jgi:hypothetical protein